MAPAADREGQRQRREALKAAELQSERMREGMTRVSSLRNNE